MPLLPFDRVLDLAPNNEAGRAQPLHPRAVGAPQWEARTSAPLQLGSTCHVLGTFRTEAIVFHLQNPPGSIKPGKVEGSGIQPALERVNRGLLSTE